MSETTLANAPQGDTQIILADSGALEVMERVQIDIQIATANKYPRNIDKIMPLIMGDATRNEDVAKSCGYTLPWYKDENGRPVAGPNVRLAEIFAARWRNLRIGPGQFIGDDGRFVTVRVVVADNETNTVVCAEVRRPVFGKNGQRYNENGVGKAIAAAASIAKRNAIFQIIPRAFIGEVYEATKRVAMGDAKTLVSRRQDVVDAFIKSGIKKERIFAVLAVTGMEGIGLEELAALNGYRNAIKDGLATKDEIFNAPEPTPESPPKVAGKDVTPTPGAFGLKAE